MIMRWCSVVLERICLTIACRIVCPWSNAAQLEFQFVWDCCNDNNNSILECFGVCTQDMY